MKTKLLTALVAFAAVGLAKADLLYWMVDANPYGIQYSYASVYTMDGENKVYLQNYAPNSNESGDVVVKDSIVAAVVNGSGISTQSFYFELYNEALETVAWTENPISGSTLGAFIAAEEFNSNWSSINGAYSLKGVDFVPEPTSGLLLLLGATMLGLKRKRAV